MYEQVNSHVAKGKRPSSIVVQTPSHHSNPDSNCDDDDDLQTVLMSREDTRKAEYTETHGFQVQGTSMPSGGQTKFPQNQSASSLLIQEDELIHEELVPSVQPIEEPDQVQYPPLPIWTKVPEDHPTRDEHVTKTPPRSFVVITEDHSQSTWQPKVDRKAQWATYQQALVTQTIFIEVVIQALYNIGNKLDYLQDISQEELTDLRRAMNNVHEAFKLVSFALIMAFDKFSKAQDKVLKKEHEKSGVDFATTVVALQHTRDTKWPSTNIRLMIWVR